MKERLFLAGVVLFQRECDFDFSDSKDVHSQPRAQLFEKPVKNEEQWLQQINRRLQVHALLKIRRKIFRDQRLGIRPLCQSPPTQSFLSEPLDSGNLWKGRKFSAGMDAPTP